MVSLENLRDLFFGKDLVQLSPIQPQTPPHQVYEENDNISPLTRDILSAVSPASREKLLVDIRKDNAELLDKEDLNLDLDLDPDYVEKMTYQGLGFYMENFVSYHGVCPVCRKSTLRKYAHSNVPVVDLVCINVDYHIQTNTCFLFQLKISLGYEYFSLRRQTISIGSRKYGQLPHTIRGTDDIDRKKIVPGYICLKLRETRIPGNYRIDQNLSFILVPDYHNIRDFSYYEYLIYKDRYGKDVISWFPQMFDTALIKEILDELDVSYEYFSETPILNPYISI